jgi:hypothetical protein
MINLRHRHINYTLFFFPYFFFLLLFFSSDEIQRDRREWDRERWDTEREMQRDQREWDWERWDSRERERGETREPEGAGVPVAQGRSDPRLSAARAEIRRSNGDSGGTRSISGEPATRRDPVTRCSREIRDLTNPWSPRPVKPDPPGTVFRRGWANFRQNQRWFPVDFLRKSPRYINPIILWIDLIIAESRFNDFWAFSMIVFRLCMV